MTLYSVLDRYLGKTVFSTIIMVLFMLISLSGIIKFVDQLKKSGEGAYNALGAGLFTLLTVPKDIEIFFPMAALLGALLGLGILAQRNELVVMQAAGFSRMQIALSVMKTAIPLLIISMLIGEWGAPQGEQLARNYRAQMMYGDSLLSTRQGLWAKDGNDFVYIKRVTGNNILTGVNIYHFDDQQRLLSVRYAAQALFDPQQKLWRLTQVEESRLQNQQQITGSQTLTATWHTTLTPDKLGVVVLEPNSLSVSGLYRYIHYLQTSGQDTKTYLFSLWSKLLQPFSMMVMMLMALSFIFGPLRSVAMGIRIITGISFGFVFYLLNQVVGQLSLVYSLHPFLAALLPTLVFFLISLWLLIKRS